MSPSAARAPGPGQGHAVLTSRRANAVARLGPPNMSAFPRSWTLGGHSSATAEQGRDLLGTRPSHRCIARTYTVPQGS